MNSFKKILYVVQNMDSKSDSLKQAFILAAENQAVLGILIPYPALPESLVEHTANFEQYLTESLKSALKDLQRDFGNGSEVPVEFLVEKHTPLDVHIIQRVLRDGFDLIIKDADPLDCGSKAGYRANDMSLLRKCPCPVWLFKGEHTKEKIKIAVAIDPISDEPAGRDLGLHLLRLTSSMAQRMGVSFSIVSSWVFTHENYLRNSPFARVPQEEVDAMVLAHQKAHANELTNLIKEAGISENYDVKHRKGAPDDIISSIIKEDGIDLLIMGTVARTGIPGFIMGNTAENILQKVDCSLLAVKPKGFVSPVKPY